MVHVAMGNSLAAHMLPLLDLADMKQKWSKKVHGLIDWLALFCETLVSRVP